MRRRDHAARFVGVDVEVALALELLQVLPARILGLEAERLGELGVGRHAVVLLEVRGDRVEDALLVGGEGFDHLCIFYVLLYILATIVWPGNMAVALRCNHAHKYSEPYSGLVIRLQILGRALHVPGEGRWRAVKCSDS